MPLRALSAAEVGRRVRIVRIAADMAAQELGEKLGKTGNAATSYVSQIEKGHREKPPRQDRLMEMANVMLGNGDLLGPGVEERVRDFLLGVTDTFTITVGRPSPDPEGEQQPDLELHHGPAPLTPPTQLGKSIASQKCYSVNGASDLLGQAA